MKTEGTAIDQQIGKLKLDQSQPIVNEHDLSFRAEGIIAKRAIRIRIVEYWKDTKQKAHETWKLICEKESKQLRLVDESIRLDTKAIKDFNDEKMRKISDERRRLESEAQKAAGRGHNRKAEELDKKVAAMPTSIQAPQIEGGAISFRETLNIEVENMKEFCKAIGSGKAPIACVQISYSNISKFISLNALTEFPGLKIVRDKQPIVTTK